MTTRNNEALGNFFKEAQGYQKRSARFSFFFFFLFFFLLASYWRGNFAEYCRRYEHRAYVLVTIFRLCLFLLLTFCSFWGGGGGVFSTFLIDRTNCPYLLLLTYFDNFFFIYFFIFWFFDFFD